MVATVAVTHSRSSCSEAVPEQHSEIFISLSMLSWVVGTDTVPVVAPAGTFT
jgi:hypothetical protein